MNIVALTPADRTIGTGLPGGLTRLISTAVTARLVGERVASPCLVERLRKLERRARADADPQAVQILASARRLLGDSVELHPLTLPYADRHRADLIGLTD